MEVSGAYPNEVIEELVKSGADFKFYDLIDEDHKELIPIIALDSGIESKLKLVERRDLCLRYLNFVIDPDTMNSIYLSAAKLSLVEVLSEMKHDIEIVQRALESTPNTVSCIEYLLDLGAKITSKNIISMINDAIIEKNHKVL